MEIWSIIGFVCPKTEPKTYHNSTRRLKLSFTFSDEKKTVSGHYAQRHYAQGHYAQGHYDQSGYYAQM